jgi:surfeit locus 1 family protein
VRGVTHRNVLLGWSLALLGIALFTRLGFWQLARMHDKQASLAAAQAVLASRDARPLAIAADPQRARLYDWTSADGQFVAAPAVLLDNQQREGRAGVRAYRVFQSTNTAAAPVLVELGWLPVPGNRRLPAIPQLVGHMHIAGLLAPPPSAGLTRAIAAPQRDGTLLTITLDVPMLRRALQLPTLAPRVLKLDPVLPIGYPRDLDILPNTLPPERHLGYAVQWFGLALTVLVTALLLTFRKPKRHPKP